MSGNPSTRVGVVRGAWAAVAAHLRPWPHEWVFLAFLIMASAKLVATVGLLHPSSITYLTLLGCTFALVCWGQHRPTPLRCRIRILGLCAISTGSYTAIKQAVPAMYGQAVLDFAQATLRSIEASLTHGALDFVQQPGSALLVDAFTICYLFFFYYLVVGPGHYYVTNLRLFRQCAVGMFTLYGLGYIGYLLLPVNGPFVWMGQREGGLIWEMGNAFVLNHSNGFDAFPSIHFGATFFLLAFDWRHYRRRFWMLLAPVLGLWMATVYLRYHYFADLLGGLVIALAGIWAARWFERTHRDDPMDGEDGLLFGTQREREDAHAPQS